MRLCAGLLGRTRELRRALAHLRHRTGRRRELFRIHGLDRIDHHHARPFVGQHGADLLQIDFRQQLHARRVERQALRAQRHLLPRFLAGYVERADARRELGQRLQQQRRLADAGVAADQHHATGHQTAAQHAIELR
jgi:hypothetical protein